MGVVYYVSLMSQLFRVDYTEVIERKPEVRKDAPSTAESGGERRSTNQLRSWEHGGWI